MGLRSFVALPINKGGVVTRFVFDEIPETNNKRITSNLAYGIDGKQTIFIAAPYRLSSGEGDRLGDVDLLYRNIVWQDIDSMNPTRFGLLVGGAIPTESDHDPKASAGFVVTHINGRNEWEVDALLQKGIDDAPDTVRYDISWQYRLYPEIYPEWGLPSLLNAVFEFGGRGEEGSTVVQQVTGGFQWVVTPRWVLEGGLIQDLNGPDDTNYLVSTRFHF